MEGFLAYADPVFKIIAILLAPVALFQLFEARRKRHIDMYWKIYEMYTSDIQTKARKDTVSLRDIILGKTQSGMNQEDLQEFYSIEYHRTKDSSQKLIDRSIINRIRFLNLTGRLLKMKLVNKDMLFDLIGIGFEHDYYTLKVVLETHRRDHNAPQMYPTFENAMDTYKDWKKNQNYYF